MARYRHHKYTWTKPWGAARHNWSFVCAKGAVNFHASTYSDNEPSCGLEFHFVSPPHGDEAPAHLDCELTGGRCWHDGTSLYAKETLWPMIEPLLLSGDHEMIFRFLEQDANRQFYDDEAESPAQREGA